MHFRPLCPLRRRRLWMAPNVMCIFSFTMAFFMQMWPKLILTLLNKKLVKSQMVSPEGLTKQSHQTVSPNMYLSHPLYTYLTHYTLISHNMYLSHPLYRLCLNIVKHSQSCLNKFEEQNLLSNYSGHDLQSNIIIRKNHGSVDKVGISWK